MNILSDTEGKKVVHYHSNRIVIVYYGFKLGISPRQRWINDINGTTAARNLGIKAPRIYASGKFNDKYWIVQKFIKGKALTGVSKQKIWRRARRIVRKLQKKNIWHNDIHPGNFKVTSAKKIYLIDFEFCSDQKDPNAFNEF